jgi:hypothetical protein
MKTYGKIQTGVLMMFGALLISPAVARAQIWTHAASSCAVDEDSASIYEVNAARLRFKGSNTGTMTARCNVVNLNGSRNPAWDLLEVVYQDPDGNTTANQVTAVLYKVHNSTGGISEIARFDSNNFGVNVNTGPQSVAFSHTFNFVSYAYYVEIKVKRTSSSRIPDVSLVRLTQQGPF